MQGSFEDYVTSRGGALLRFAFVLSGDRHLAEDLVQEVLTRVHLRWHRVSQVEQPGAAPDPASRQAARDEVWRLLARLAPKQRAVLVLRFYEDLTDPEIAEVIGCRRATVRVHASRGMSRLREILGSASYAPQHVGGES